MVNRRPKLTIVAPNASAEEAASIAVETLQTADTRVELARLVAFDSATLGLYEERLAAAR